MARTVDPLSRFGTLTREWFMGTFEAPTAAQAQAWDAIADGHDTLVIAPTGSGKTLAAFLWAVDRLAHDPGEGHRGSRVLYVSPLKALAVDVERNLRTPLTGIVRMAERRGMAPADISVGLRSGDTPPQRRRELISRPPDILITTPESLFLMLTSAARETLTSIQTVIVDEVHAVAGTKRGAHLALSLERLDALLAAPAQRIGLSATVRPPAEMARFLSGAGGRTTPTAIVAPPTAKTFDVTVQVPVPDMANLENNSIWPDIEQRVVDLIEAHRSSIVFANSRRLAERLTARINEIHAERAGIELGGYNPGVAGGAPAHIVGSGQTYGAQPVLARAHHGSVSKETRAAVEDALKSGQLRAVVATSSLELGIDMGAVDMVIQVETPPSVASGLQRIGRAGHQVGELSRGVLLPKHRTDLIGCAVSVQRMLRGQIETLQVPANPLDVLAQHTVAACALEPIDADRWFETVRRSAPFATLPRSAFEATLDLLSGKYPSTDFAELRPRLVYDRDTGTLTARPGAQRLAVTSGGAIPDRGLFTVYLAANADTEKPSRVGELDEEMVYESRPGDVISLGATSWRITEITHDRVLVVPAPGEPARLPFWRGDGVGRPAELGAAIGAFTGAVSRMDRAAFDEHCRAIGLDAFATDNLWGLLDEQRAAAGTVPTDTTLLVERFRDELGDWRIILHSPYGLRVHGPLALMVGVRVYQRYGVDDKPTASDDGIIVRLPDTGETPTGADLFVFDADEVESLVTAEVGGSALFASRFRECAARALLLPRRHPGKRSPLWHQRQRAARLLEVARRHPDFPIVLEAVRECLQDVYDVPALTGLMERIAARQVRVVEVETATPSPFAAALLFGYVGAFMYEGDSPLAERRAAALSLDPTLLAELLGRVELRELLDQDVVATTTRQLQSLTPDRMARDAEAVADLLRVLGPLTEDEIARRCTAADAGAWLDGLHSARRALRVSFAGRSWWVAIEDIGRLRDGLGVAVPVGVPATFAETVDDPLGELLSRFARTRGPFTTAEAAARFGLGLRVTADVLGRLAADRRLMPGEFTDTATDIAGSEQWCDTEVLRILRRRSLAALRAQVEPVDTAAYARFLPAWQQVGSASASGVDGLASVIDQLAGIAIPASAVEPLVFGQRVRDYQPAMLDELLASGEVIWSGLGAISGGPAPGDGWVSFHPAETAPLTLAAPADLELTDIHRAVLEKLESRRRVLLPATQHRRRRRGHTQRGAMAADLVGAGDRRHVRAGAGAAIGHRAEDPRRPAHRQRRAPRLSQYVAVACAPARHRPDLVRTVVGVTGRRSGFHGAGSFPGRSAVEPLRGADPRCSGRRERTGRIRNALQGADRTGGGRAMSARLLRRIARWSTVLDGHDRRPVADVRLSASTNAANTRLSRPPWCLRRPIRRIHIGAALPWPVRDADSAHRPARKAGALVVLVGGQLTWFLERGGRSLLSFYADPMANAAAAGALADLVAARRVDSFLVERIDGTPALEHRDAVAAALEAAGFSRTPRGLRLR